MSVKYKCVASSVASSQRAKLTACQAHSVAVYLLSEKYFYSLINAFVIYFSRNRSISMAKLQGFVR